MKYNKDNTVNISSLNNKQKKDYIFQWDDFCYNSNWHKDYIGINPVNIDRSIRLVIESYMYL